MAASALLAEPITRLQTKPASAVKKDGWRVSCAVLPPPKEGSSSRTTMSRRP